MRNSGVPLDVMESLPEHSLWLRHTRQRSPLQFWQEKHSRQGCFLENPSGAWGTYTLPFNPAIFTKGMVGLLSRRLAISHRQFIVDVTARIGIRRFQVSVFRCRDLAPRFPDTRNLQTALLLPSGPLIPAAVLEFA